jgi:hypothetical protein
MPNLLFCDLAKNELEGKQTVIVLSHRSLFLSQMTIMFCFFLFQKLFSVIFFLFLAMMEIITWQRMLDLIYRPVYFEFNQKTENKKSFH